MSIQMFRNATIYRFAADYLPEVFIADAMLTDALATKQAREPASQEISSPACANRSTRRRYLGSIPA